MYTQLANGQIKAVQVLKCLKGPMSLSRKIAMGERSTDNWERLASIRLLRSYVGFQPTPFWVLSAPT
jgi:hypothetical protein